MINLYLRQKVFSIGEKFTFFDENQNVIYTAKGNIFSVPKKFRLYYGENEELRIERKFFSFMPKYRFFDMPANREVAYMRQNFALAKKFQIETPNGNFRIEGSVFGFTFQLVNQQEEVVAYMNKRILSWGDTYEITIDETKVLPKLVCGIMIAYDNSVHNEASN